MGSQFILGLMILVDEDEWPGCFLRNRFHQDMNWIAGFRVQSVKHYSMGASA